MRSSLSSCAGPVVMAVAQDYLRNLSLESDSENEFENALLYDICRGKRSLLVWRSEYIFESSSACNLSRYLVFICLFHVIRVSCVVKNFVLANSLNKFLSGRHPVDYWVVSKLMCRTCAENCFSKTTWRRPKQLYTCTALSFVSMCALTFKLVRSSFLPCSVMRCLWPCVSMCVRQYTWETNTRVYISLQWFVRDWQINMKLW